jgi:hypothetical protein
MFKINNDNKKNFDDNNYLVCNVIFKITFTHHGQF